MPVTGGASRPLGVRCGAEDCSTDGEALIPRRFEGLPSHEAFDILAPVADLNQDMGEPGFRVDVVEAACCDRGVGTSPDVDGILGSGERGVAHGELDGSVGVFAAIGVQVEAAVVEQADEARPDAVGEAVSDGGGLRRGFGQAAGGGFEERLPSFEGGRQLVLPHAEALIGRLEQDALLDGEQLADSRKGLIAEAGFRR